MCLQEDVVLGRVLAEHQLQMWWGMGQAVMLEMTPQVPLKVLSAEPHSGVQDGANSAIGSHLWDIPKLGIRDLGKDSPLFFPDMLPQEGRLGGGETGRTAQFPQCLQQAGCTHRRTLLSSRPWRTLWSWSPWDPYGPCSPSRSSFTWGTLQERETGCWQSSACLGPGTASVGPTHSALTIVAETPAFHEHQLISPCTRNSPHSLPSPSPP